MRTLLYEGAVPELQAGVQADRPADADWLVQPAYRIDHAAAFLAELNVAARPRPAAVHQARAEALDQQIANTSPSQSAHISAHAFAVHDLTGVYGPDGSAVRDTMLRFVATHPPGERATLQASKVAALLSDALGPRARMALLDHIIILLGPIDGDPSVHMALARDSALVLLLLDADAVEPCGLTDVAMPITDTPTGLSSPSPEHGRDQETSVDGGDAADDANNRSTDAIAEIASEVERAIVAAVAERHARYRALGQRDRARPSAGRRIARSQLPSKEQRGSSSTGSAPARSLGSPAMETINGCTVVAPSEAPEPVRFGPSETQGAYVILLGSFPPGHPAPPLHLHPHTDEAFYVADGDATFLLGEREVPVTAGGLVFVPRGTAHTVWNSGDRPVRGLILISPGAAEHEFVPVDAG